MNIAVLASGKGTNLSAIINAVKKGKLKVNIALVITDNFKAGAIERAERAGVKALVIERKNFADKASFEAEIITQLKEHKVNLVVLAGFMRMLSPWFIQQFKNKIINIHPSLLPAFKGANAIKDAFDYGVKLTGVSVHFVDEEMDNGAIIIQKEVRVEENDTLGSLEEKIHKTEHKLYPEAIKLFAEGKLKLQGRKALIR